MNYKNFHPTSVATNHSSALAFPEDVEEYFTAELGYQAMAGPFHSAPIDNLHYSPLMSRPKPDGTKRIIVDLSWPLGKGVNDHIEKGFYDGIECSLRYPTVDHIVAAIQLKGPSSLLMKVDLKRAYRNLRSDPFDYSVLGLSWGDNTYIDLGVPFGVKGGALAMQMSSDCITYLMGTQGYWACTYLDDTVCVSSPSKANSAYLSLQNLILSLGLPINKQKLEPPSSEINCLGIMVNASTGELTIPVDKLKRVRELCWVWRSRKYATRKGLQRLLGHLLHVHRCVKPARLFVNRILTLMREIPDKGRIGLTNAFYKDINWFCQFLDAFNGVVAIPKKLVLPKTVFIDACLQGFGAYYDRNVYFEPVPTAFRLVYSIVHLEMLNALIAIRMWAVEWANKTVHMYCDNQAVVQVLNSGKSKDEFLAACARTIWLNLAINNIDLQVIHIGGKQNLLADTLSRWFHFESIDNSVVKYLKTCQWTSVDSSFLHPDFCI